MFKLLQKYLIKRKNLVTCIRGLHVVELPYCIIISTRLNEKTRETKKYARQNLSYYWCNLRHFNLIYEVTLLY